jgi:hypothetical protein
MNKQMKKTIKQTAVLLAISFVMTAFTCYGKGSNTTGQTCTSEPGGVQCGTGGGSCKVITTQPGNNKTCGGTITFTWLSGNCMVCTPSSTGRATCHGTATVTQYTQTGACVGTTDSNGNFTCNPPASLPNPTTSVVTCPCQS